MASETQIIDLAREILREERGAIVGQRVMDLFELPSFHDVPKPKGATLEELAVCAALLELFASRRGELPPGWTTEFGGIAPPRFLMGGYEREFPSFGERWRIESPEPLKRRNLWASADFLAFN